VVDLDVKGENNSLMMLDFDKDFLIPSFANNCRAGRSAWTMYAISEMIEALARHKYERSLRIDTWTWVSTPWNLVHPRSHSRIAWNV
jgi:hypothetical protein